MGIRYDNNLNKRMNNIVRNFNKRQVRLEQSGYRNIPKKQYVSELKAVYTNRADLERELKWLESFSKSDLGKRDIGDNEKAIKWNYSYIKNNSKNALSYFEKEYARVEKRVGRFPGERTYLDTISAKIDLLKKGVKEMTASDIRSGVTIINEFTMSPTKRKDQYRGFLSELDWVMEQVGYSEETRERFFNKFKQLTPTQFLYAYDNNDIIAKIYSLYHKDYGDEEAHLTDPANAPELLAELLNRADEIIADAKLNMD